MAANKTAYFEPQYLELRDRLVNVLSAGTEKPEITANQWTPLTVGRLSAAVNVAEGALDAAKDHASAQYASRAQLADRPARAAARRGSP